jgi:hypothetical protein
MPSREASDEVSERLRKLTSVVPVVRPALRLDSVISEHSPLHHASSELARTR